MHSNYFMYAAPTNGIHTNAIPNVSNTNLKQQTRTVTQQSVTITNNTTGNRINTMSQALVQNAGNVHQNNHNAAQSNAHVCQICCQVFQKASSLKRHMRVHSTSSTNDSDNSPYKCNACKIDYHNAIAFEEHIKTEHGQPQAFKCVDCGCFRTVQLMTSQPFRCEGCAQQKSEPYEPIGSVSYRITSCNSSSNSQQIHVNHVKANKIDPMDLLIQTMRTGNEINGRRRKLHQCPECNKCYKHQSTLAMHKKIHTGEYKYKCQYCQKEFYLAEYYNRHMRVHTKEKPYQCDVCDKAFSQSNTLIQHKRIHSGEKPYGCTICGKAFSVRDYLLKHIRVHTGEKPFECEICGKKYSQRSGLKSHQKSHFPEPSLVNGSQSQSQDQMHAQLHSSSLSLI